MALSQPPIPWKFLTAAFPLNPKPPFLRPVVTFPMPPNVVHPQGTPFPLLPPAPNAQLRPIATSAPLFQVGPPGYYTYYYKHAHRLRLEELYIKSFLEASTDFYHFWIQEVLLLKPPHGGFRI